MAKGGKRPGAGRPKGAVSGHTLEAQELRKRLIKAAQKNWDAIIFSLIDNAIAGNTIAQRELLDRVLGKAIQPMEHSGKDGAPIQVQQITGMTISLASGPIITSSANANPVPNQKS